MKTDHSKFRRAVDGPGRDTIAAADAGDRADHRAEASFHHWNGGVRAIQYAEDVGIDLRTPVLGLAILEQSVDSHAGIIEKEVESAESFLHYRKQRRDLACIADVGDHSECGVSEFVCQRIDTVFPTGYQDDFDAFRDQQSCGRLANAAGRSGDHRYLVCEILHLHYLHLGEKCFNSRPDQATTVDDRLLIFRLR